MAERTIPAPALRLLCLSLTVLALLTTFNRSLHPLVQGFGLAHARVIDSLKPAVLVVDNLQRSDVPALQQVFSGDIWSRKAYRVHEILLPTLTLAFAMALLAGFLSLSLVPALGYLGRIRSQVATPTPSMAIGLFFGGLAALASGGRFPAESALLPFVIAVLAVAIRSLFPRPNADRLAHALEMVSASRWFWLGVAAICFQRPGVAGPQFTLFGSTLSSIVAVVIGFLLLHWATRAPARISLCHLDGDRRSLVALCDRLTLLSIHELWVVLPLLLLSVNLFPQVSQLGVLSTYLLTSIVSALLMKWALEGRPPGGGSGLARLAGSLWRVVTLVLVLALAGFLASNLGEITTVTVSIAALVVALGLVRGQPWFSQKKVDDFATCVQRVDDVASRPKRPRCLASVFAGLGAAAALLVAIGSAANIDWNTVAHRDPALIIRSQLQDSLGHRVRYIRYSEGSVVWSQSLTREQRLQAQRIIRGHFPSDRIAIVGVSPWRWELAAMAFVVATIASVAAAVPAIILGAISPLQPLYGLFFAALAGVNGAFALGAQWGWFWLDPSTHGAAFLLCTLMGGGGMAWIRQRPRAGLGPAPGQQGWATSSPASANPLATKLPPSPAGTPDDPYQVMRIDPLCVELGAGLLNLVDPRRGASLVERVGRIRRHIATEMGIVMPEVRFRNNHQLKPDAFVIRVRGVEVGRGTLESERFLAIGPENKLETLTGTRTVDPTYGMPGVWIDAVSRPKAEGVGCLIFDPISVVAALLTEICQRYFRAFLTLEAMGTLLVEVAKGCPTTVAIVREKHSLVVLRDVYRGLLAERVSVRDHEVLLNVLAATDGPVEALIAECRQELKVAICGQYSAKKILRHIRLDSDLEREMLGILRSSGWPEGTADRYQARLLAYLDVAIERGVQPIFVVHPRLRAPFSLLMNSLVSSVGGVVVLGTNEIPSDVQLSSVSPAV